MRLLDFNALAGLLLVGRRERLVEVVVEFPRRILGHVEQREIGGVGRAGQERGGSGSEDATDHLNLHSA